MIRHRLHDLDEAAATRAWHIGIAPQLPDRGLKALREAMLLGDPRLLQGSTVEPFVSEREAPCACDGACPIAFAFWAHLGFRGTADEIEHLWTMAVHDANAALEEREEGANAVARWINLWDDTPTAEAVAFLLPLVEESLRDRGLLQAEAVA